MLSQKILKKASFLDKLLYYATKDKRIEDAIKEEYGEKKEIKEIELMEHDILDYINNDNYPVSAIKTLLCSIMLCNNIEYKKLPATREIKIKCELNISHVAISKHLKKIEKQRWIKKINYDKNGELLNNRLQHYIIIINKDRAVEYFNFVAEYEGEKQGKRRIKQLQKIINRYLIPLHPTEI